MLLLRQMALCAVLITPSTALAQGVAARFAAFPAVEGEDLEVRLEIEDTIGAVGQVEVELRTDPKKDWRAVKATRGHDGVTWRARFPAEAVPLAGETIELRASILGARGGLLVDIGFDDEPHTVDVSSAERAAEEAKLLTKQGREEELNLIAYVGAEGRAGSSARARVTLAVGLATSERTELLFGVSVGPTFSRPALLEGGGPIVLGFEAAFRGYTLDPETSRYAPFVEGFTAFDARLPGFDPALGARAGLSVGLGAYTRLDLSLGGGAVIYGAAGGPEPTLGFTGGGRLAIRFGAAREEVR